jgi:hypothetical protein
MKLRTVLAAAGLATVALITPAPVQAAAPLMQERFTFTDQLVECGYDFAQTFSISNLLLDSNPSSAGQFFRFSYNWRATGVYTNPLTGEQAYIAGHGVYKEIQPRDLGGGQFTYVELNVATFVITDSSGQVVLREAGSVAVTWLFDSLSDSAPGGDQLSATPLRVSGMKPSLTGDVDYCAVLDSAIG